MGGLLNGRLCRLQEPLLSGTAALCLLVLCTLPLLFLAGELLGQDGGLAQFDATLGQAHAWMLLLDTVCLALAITALALALGVPLAVLLAKTDLVGRHWVMWIYGFQFFLPPFLVVLGWFQLLGQQGLLGSESTSQVLFSSTGVVLTLGLLFSPVVVALTVLGLRGINPSMEEAARLVAGPGRVILRILLPLAWPAMVFATLVVFTLSISEVGVPMFLRVKTYPAAVFSRLGGVGYSPGEAFALVLPLLLLALVLLLLERRFIGGASFASLGLRSAHDRLYHLGRFRIPLSIGVWTLCGVTLLPLAALASKAGKGGFSALAGWLGGSVGNSVLVALVSATVITALGIVVGTGLAHGKQGSRLLDGAAMLAFITPASVLGVGLVATWNRPVTHLLYGTWAILVLGLVARYAIVGVRTVAAVASRSSPSYEQAAAVLGAGYLRRLIRITIPMHSRGIGVACLLALVFCLRDLDTVVIFYPPGRETLPVRIFTLEANGPQEVVAALATLHVALTALLLALGGSLLWYRRRA